MPLSSGAINQTVVTLALFLLFGFSPIKNLVFFCFVSLHHSFCVFVVRCFHSFPLFVPVCMQSAFILTRRQRQRCAFFCSLLFNDDDDAERLSQSLFNFNPISSFSPLTVSILRLPLSGKMSLSDCFTLTMVILVSCLL
uniref:Uncharacterized protein n=1 Tax=Schistocephalus solidus TaxID=70667 RepID=A0A0X3P4B9_SCHSO